MAGSLAPVPPSFDALVAGAAWMWVEAGGSGGGVWRLSWPSGDVAYVKHGEGGVADAIADEAARLRWLAGRVPAPVVRLFACTAGQAWSLTDAVPGFTGDAWLAREPDALPAIVAGSVALMRQLHALPIENCPFEAGHRFRLAAARRNVAAGSIDEDDFDADHAGWTAAAMLAETEALAPERLERVVTHGDFSLGNILFDGAGAVTGCIDVGRLGVADPYQDIAILWQNLTEFGAEGLLEAELGHAFDEQRLRFHRCLDELF